MNPLEPALRIRAPNTEWRVVSLQTTRRRSYRPFIILLFLISLPTQGITALVVSVNVTNPLLSYNGTSYSGGDFGCVAGPVQSQPGDLPTAAGPFTTSVDSTNASIARAYTWGMLTCDYATAGDTLNITIHVTNVTSANINSIELYAINLSDPVSVDRSGLGPWLSVYGLEYGILEYSASSVVVVNEQATRMTPLYLSPTPRGFAVITGMQVLSPLFALELKWPYLPPRLAQVGRTLPKHASLEYHLSINFSDLAPVGLDNIARAYAAMNPQVLNWPDRRPIAVFTVSSRNFTYPTLTPVNPLNPRYYRWVDPSLNIHSPSGLAAFRAGLLSSGNIAINNILSANGQGLIVWDIEGQQYMQFVGDPRYLDLDLLPVFDEFFHNVTSAGLRCGVTLEMRALKIGTPGGASHGYTDDVETMVTTLKNKIDFAYKRWGCTLFYVDCNDPKDFPALLRIAAEYRNILLIPEHASSGDYRATSGYCDVSQLSVCNKSREIFPNGFNAISINIIANPPATALFDELVQHVSEGDVLFWPAQVGDYRMALVRSIYSAAGR